MIKTESQNGWAEAFTLNSGLSASAFYTGGVVTRIAILDQDPAFPDTRTDYNAELHEALRRLVADRDERSTWFAGCVCEAGEANGEQVWFYEPNGGNL